MPAGTIKKIIDWKKVDQLLEAGCLTTEIAAYFGICRDTLYKRCKMDKQIDFSTYSQEKKAKGESLLRTKQYDVAMEGDKTMLVWLGKQRLDQSDNKHSVGTVEDVLNELAEYFKTHRKISGSQESERSNMEDEQSLLDQGQEREQD